MEKSKQVLDEIKKSLKEDKIFTSANYDQLVAPITEIYKETSTNVYLIVSNQLIKFRLEIKIIKAGIIMNLRFHMIIKTNIQIIQQIGI